MTSDAEVLLARADKLLDSPDRTALGNSARLAAFLARQAVEDLIDTRCAELTGVPELSGPRKRNWPCSSPSTRVPAGPALIDAGATSTEPGLRSSSLRCPPYSCPNRGPALSRPH